MIRKIGLLAPFKINFRGTRANPEIMPRVARMGYIPRSTRLKTNEDEYRRSK